VRSPIQKLVARARSLWVVMRTERAAPRDIFWSVFIGAALGCTPLLFVRPWIAVAITTALRKNRLWSWAAAHVSGNWLLNPVIALVEIQLSHRVRTGAWVPLTLKDVMERGAVLLLDWTLGSIPVGLVVGVLFGLAGASLARRAEAQAA